MKSRLILPIQNWIRARTRADWVLIGLVFLACLPNFFISPKAVVRGLYPFLILAAVLPSRQALAWFTFPALLVLPGAFYFWFTYHSPTNVTPWIILAGTDLRESLDFVGGQIVPIAIYALFLSLFFAWCLRHLKGPVLVRRSWKIGLLALLIVPTSYVRRSPTLDGFYDEMISHFTFSYPWNLVMGYHAAKREMKLYNEADFVAGWNLNVKSAGPPISASLPETYVLVIGESARRDHHGLYGYTENTNPEMEKLGDLVVFRDLITIHPHTAASVPTILTKTPGLTDIEKIPPSFIQVFQQGQFKTYWLSNQAGMGGGDNRVAVYARKSDFFQSFHIHNLSLPWAYDGELLPLFLKKVIEPSPKKLIVLHLQGSHYGFSRRYPSEFNRFKEPYDNTILYTDWILGQVINELKKMRGLAGLIYLSDHGLLLNQCGKPFSHFDNKASFEIPFWIWTNSDWQKKYPAKLAQLKASANKPVTTAYVFDTLVDMADLRYDGYEDGMSLMSPHLALSPRMVRTYSQVVDYDTSQDDEGCHLQSLNLSGK